MLFSHQIPHKHPSLKLEFLFLSPYLDQFSVIPERGTEGKKVSIHKWSSQPPKNHVYINFHPHPLKHLIAVLQVSSKIQTDPKNVLNQMPNSSQWDNKNKSAIKMIKSTNWKNKYCKSWPRDSTVQLTWGGAEREMGMLSPNKKGEADWA